MLNVVEGQRILPKPLQVRSGTLVLSGYGLQLAVERGNLLVADGICDERRQGRFSRATAGLRRLVVLGHSGFVTLGAMRWLRDTGAGLVQIDADGEVIAAWGPVGLNDARLRRMQALAPGNGVGLKVGRELVRRKLEGQLALLARLPDGLGSAAIIRENLGSLDRASTPTQLRLFESAAAVAYWKAWEHVPIRFVRRDESRVPSHWRSFGPRGSPLANGPRQAVSPGNCVMNMLYAILQGEVRIAALTMGLDPGMGVLHVDQPARDSLALDLMEAVRPDVDAYVLELLSSRVFRASDFFETRQGVCRVLPPLTHELVETATHWARRIAPVTEWAAAMFATPPGSRDRKIPTLLTQDRRSLGRDGVRQNPRKQPQAPKIVPAGVCRYCGVILSSRRRSYCNDRLPKVYAEHLEALQKAGPAAIGRLMAEGRDPTHGGQAARMRATSLMRRKWEAAEWDRQHKRPDPEEFRKRILPKLKTVPLGQMVKATGLSLIYCSLVRRGVYLPHPRHWESLQALAALGEAATFAP
jgi:CRISPR-associated endonuclease Cas1